MPIKIELQRFPVNSKRWAHPAASAIMDPTFFRRENWKNTLVAIEHGTLCWIVCTTALYAWAMLQG
jgi:hypothetical protein